VTDLHYQNPDLKIIFLHHSTGKNVWDGDVKQKNRLSFNSDTCLVPRILKEYNDRVGLKVSIEELSFPSGKNYPWANYPFDYYNIWVKNGDDTAFMNEPSLEMLTKEYDIIIFKHCFPVSKIEKDEKFPDVNSEVKTLTNYKLQYQALKEKLHTFPKTKFLIWTGAALNEGQTSVIEAERAKEFSIWVKENWDLPEDNIEIFDFREIETEGGLYLKPEYAMGEQDSHPNMKISSIAAHKLVTKIIDLIENKGSSK
jgi:hypothetical protein